MPTAIARTTVADEPSTDVEILPKDVPTTNRFSDPRNFINRELSWLEFNRRVLEEAQDPIQPLIELIQVRTENREELDALNEWLDWILCFLKHAAIEFQPTQFAIDKIPGIGKTIRCRNILRKDLNFGGRLSNNGGSGNSCRHLLSY